MARDGGEEEVFSFQFSVFSEEGELGGELRGGLVFVWGR